MVEQNRRLGPDEPFPAYSYVPGKHPHPISDPCGHSYGKVHTPVEALDPERWWESPSYLRGLDLFDAGYFWEAHEVWEALWHAAGRRGEIASMVQGLIKLAAAGVKHHEEKPAGVVSLARGAAGHWRDVVQGRGQGQGSYLGFGLSELIALAESIAECGWPNPAPHLVPKREGPIPPT